MSRDMSPRPPLFQPAVCLTWPCHHPGPCFRSYLLSAPANSETGPRLAFPWCVEGGGPGLPGEELGKWHSHEPHLGPRALNSAHVHTLAAEGALPPGLAYIRRSRRQCLQNRLPIQRCPAPAILAGRVGLWSAMLLPGMAFQTPFSLFTPGAVPCGSLRRAPDGHTPRR